MRHSSIAGSKSARRVVVATLGLALVTLAATASPAPPKDMLAEEIDRWSSFLVSHKDSGEIWNDVRQASEPGMLKVQNALRDGRRLLALQRLSYVRPNLAASAYLGARPAGERTDIAAFEAEWARMGQVLRPDLTRPSAGALDGVHPAAVRALGEVAIPQARIYYEASLEYGRSTMAESGLFYLGAARAQQEFAALCRSLSSPSSRKAPPLRPLTKEITSLEDDLLLVYKPPVSIDRHPEFIVAHSLLKEARELDLMGLRYGALLRYLEAVMRSAPLRTGVAPPAAEAIATEVRKAEERLLERGLDHSVAQLFIEAAHADLETSAASAAVPALAATIASEVLPRYFAALEKAPRAVERAAPRVTVTMVRWPYT